MLLVSELRWFHTESFAGLIPLHQPCYTPLLNQHTEYYLFCLKREASLRISKKNGTEVAQIKN